MKKCILVVGFLMCWNLVAGEKRPPVLPIKWNYPLKKDWIKQQATEVRKGGSWVKEKQYKWTDRKGPRDVTPYIRSDGTIAKEKNGKLVAVEQDIVEAHSYIANGLPPLVVGNRIYFVLARVGRHEWGGQEGKEIKASLVALDFNGKEIWSCPFLSNADGLEYCTKYKKYPIYPRPTWPNGRTNEYHEGYNKYCCTLRDIQSLAENICNIASTPTFHLRVVYGEDQKLYVSCGTIWTWTFSLDGKLESRWSLPLTRPGNQYEGETPFGLQVHKVLADGTIYGFCAAGAMGAICLNPDKSVKWIRKSPDRYKDMVQDMWTGPDGTLYTRMFGAGDFLLAAIDPTTGKDKWTMPIGYYGQISFGKDCIFVPQDKPQRVERINLDGKLLGIVTEGAPPLPLVDTEGNFYMQKDFKDGDGKFQARVIRVIDPNNKVVREIPIPKLSLRVLGEDNKIWMIARENFDALVIAWISTDGTSRGGWGQTTLTPGWNNRYHYIVPGVPRWIYPVDGGLLAFYDGSDMTFGYRTLHFIPVTGVKPPKEGCSSWSRYTPME